MPRLLPGDVVECHRRDGSCIPMRVLLPTEACGCRHTFAPDNFFEERSERGLAPGAVAPHAAIIRHRGEIPCRGTTVERSR